MIADTEIRCYCRSKMLLGKFGVDPATGEPVIHIKAHKGDTVYVEAIVVSGIVKLRCRSCGRWHRVRIVKGAPVLQPTEE